MIPEDLKKRIDYVISYVETTLTDWIPIKIHIVSSLPPNERKYFSVRHNVTKKITINALEKEIIEYWKEQTGIMPTVDPARIQDPSWVGSKRGQYFKKLNAERKLKRQQQANDTNH